MLLLVQGRGFRFRLRFGLFFVEHLYIMFHHSISESTFLVSSLAFAYLNQCSCTSVLLQIAREEGKKRRTKGPKKKCWVCGSGGDDDEILVFRFVDLPVDNDLGFDQPEY